jgi:hypothetical protein
MSNINSLITNVTFDIIAVTTIWGLINSEQSKNGFSFYINSKYINYELNYRHSYNIFLGAGVSALILSKYYR